MSDDSDCIILVSNPSQRPLFTKNIFSKNTHPIEDTDTEKNCKIRGKGRPAKYKTHTEYVRSCNRIAKFRDMTHEKAQEQIRRYTILLDELKEWVRTN